LKKEPTLYQSYARLINRLSALVLLTSLFIAANQRGMAHC